MFIVMSVWKGFFYQTNLHWFCIISSETVLVDTSKTIAGDRSNRLLFWLNINFFHKLAMNISIDNRYCNRLIHLGGPIFTVNDNGVYLCLQLRPNLKCALGNVVFCSKHRPPATIHHLFFLWLCKASSIPDAPENMSHKDIHYNSPFGQI